MYSKIIASFHSIKSLTNSTIRLIEYVSNLLYICNTLLIKNSFLLSYIFNINFSQNLLDN